MAEPIEMLSEVWTRGAKKPCIRWGPDLPMWWHFSQTYLEACPDCSRYFQPYLPRPAVMQPLATSTVATYLWRWQVIRNEQENKLTRIGHRWQPQQSEWAWRPWAFPSCRWNMATSPPSGEGQTLRRAGTSNHHHPAVTRMEHSPTHHRRWTFSGKIKMIN